MVFHRMSCRVNAENDITVSDKRLFGWIGLASLLLIIPVKAIRFVDETTAYLLLFGIAPSLLGPAGLFFLLLSTPGRSSRLTLPQLAALICVIGLGLEFVQLLPRPGILTKVHYTFDWLDILASILSVCAAYLVVFIMTKRKVASTNARPNPPACT